MYHRISQGTGLGNPRQARLLNIGKLSPVMKECIEEAIELFFKKWGGVDYMLHLDGITFGIEPSYQYDKLKIIEINVDKANSWIMDGKAWGAYGSELVSTSKRYSEYKKNGKFKKFVDKWHPKIWNSL